MNTSTFYKTISTILILLGILSIQVYSNGYNITVKIHNLSNQEIYLGYHYGSKLLVSDTAVLDNQGRGVFTGKTKLPGGLYLIYLPVNQKYFDIILADNQEFAIENDTSQFQKNISISNSPINETFYTYQQFLQKKKRKIQELRKQKKSLKEGADATRIEQISQKIESIDKEVKEKQKSIITQNQDNFLGTMLKAGQNVQIPDPPQDESGNVTDSTYQFRYYKNHFFDNIDFSDKRILRTPFYERKLKQYFSTLPQSADTLIPQVDSVIKMARANDEVYKFTVSFLFNHFLKSKVMGMENVYVHIAENYYLSGEAPWADSTFLAKLRKRVKRLQPNLVGTKAPDIPLVTKSGKSMRLHEVSAPYTVLIFWEPGCSHCKKVIPKLYDNVFQQYKESGLRVLAFYTHNKTDKWTEFIDDHGLQNWTNVYDPYNKSGFRDLYDVYSTPTIYLLNKNKKIVAKRIGVESVQKFLKQNL